MWDARHHRRSIRLRDYDYRGEGVYFVTICTQKRVLSFEDTALKAMAERCWLDISRHFPHVDLDEWIVMPNHVHGILVMNEVAQHGAVGAHHDAPLRLESAYPAAMKGALGVVVRLFKGAVTRQARSAGYEDFGWQRNYYERIIRSQAELDATRAYIIQNPERWQEDENHPSRMCWE